MPINIIADFFNIINVQLFDNASILLVACFIIWEIPRSIKILSDEYTKGLYPEGGRVIDLGMFAIGIAAALYFMAGNALKIVSFLKTPGITAFFLVILVVIPLIIALGFLKRFFARMEGNSVTVFLTQGFLDLMHTAFQIALALLAVPAIGYLLFGGLVGNV
jgi:hypothetical protein